VNRAALALVTIAVVSTLAPGATPDESALEVFWIGAADGEALAVDGALRVFAPVTALGSADRDDARFRIAIESTRRRPSARLTLVSVNPANGRVRDRLRDVELVPGPRGRLISPWLVLVSSAEDRAAPHLLRHALKVALGDRVEARARLGAARAVLSSMSVGMPPGGESPQSIRRLALRVTVLRTEPGGSPIVGGGESGARDVVRHQVSVLNEVFAPCAITAGRPEDVEVVVADPPGPCMLSVGGRSGLPSAGGQVRLTADGRRYGPWKVGVGYTPVETARALSRELEAVGFAVELSVNARGANAAFGTADLIVRRRDGELAELGGWPDRPLSTDRRQSLVIGAVRLDDGLEPYGPNDLVAGTLEERTLVKALASGNPRVAEVFVVSRFTGSRKQGESFVASNRSALQSAAIVDWRALARARQAYTMAHELGHLLLDDLGHPDGRGDPRTFLLMHSRSSSAVGGPRRLTPEQCAAMRLRGAQLLR
jgi:hypothetical protein